ncbi:hypothetical protein VNO77_24938 [Canavalia gladiata]|uniref:Bifunctional inhibitor/plant lipid transfer protein/seed storage helical domain-containing protein n=1 Tax=Canavalia gladiata TaxID=3824 RepID=A0AAN9QD62_CANGL
MATKASSSVALFLALNLLFFALVSACGKSPGPNPNPNPKPIGRANPSSGGSSPSGGSNNSGTKCPRDVLKLALCTNVLNGLLNLTLGQPPKAPCCSLFNGLIDLEASVCLCTALKADILGIVLNIPISLNLLLNTCSKKVPRDFKCV